MKRFRIKSTDTIKASLFNNEGRLIANLYDSGFTTIAQVKSALLRKVNDYFKSKNVELSIINEDEQTYWSNRTK